MTTTGDTQEYAGHCIVGCGWQDTDAEHPSYCERTVDSKAEGVTEPGWAHTQFWCSVIHPFHNGLLTRSEVSESDKNRGGVQLEVSVRDDAATQSFGWRETKFNLSAAQARQLAAQLVAAADSNDGISKNHHLMRRIEKLAKGVGVEVYGA
jgi:hypothetical protein